jgi:hypothetical protein
MFSRSASLRSRRCVSLKQFLSLMRFKGYCALRLLEEVLHGSFQRSRSASLSRMYASTRVRSLLHPWPELRAGSTSVALPHALLLHAIYGYRLEVDAIGLRFDKSPAPLALEAARR